MTLPGWNLYAKIIAWMFLNLLLLVFLACGGAWYALSSAGSDGILPASLFSSRSDALLRLISANLQYRSALDWSQMLGQQKNRMPLALHAVTLDTETLRDPAVPDRMLRKAAALPRASYTFCPEPDVMFWDVTGGSLFKRSDKRNTEYGLPPVPPVLYMREQGRYWFGRILYIPDNNSQIHTVLMAMESESFDGDGLFLDMKWPFLLTAFILVVSVLWWIPFISHLSRPLKNMAAFAQRMEADGFARIDAKALDSPEFSGLRGDEIGRLGRGLACMTRRMNQVLTGQSQFIRYIAHELNTPIAKAQMSLGLLECRLDGENRRVAEKAQVQVDRIAELTNDVLQYLHAKSRMDEPKWECVELCGFFKSIVQSEAPEADVHAEVVPPDLVVVTDREYLRRAVVNVLRNALKYAGGCGPVFLSARSDGAGRVVLSVEDCGPGVPDDDLPSLAEPFYRGRAAMTHPGGTGLGLAIAKHCAGVLKGEVSYGNRAPHGFFFRISFKAADGVCTP